MRWTRLALVVAIAAAGLGGSYRILSDPDAPRWLLAVSGLLGLAGIAAAFTLAAFTAVTIVEDVRPSFRFRKPVVPLSLSHTEPAMLGYKQFRNHPIRFWGGVTLNNRFFLGFMLFCQPEHLRLRDERDRDTTPRRPEGAEAEG